MFYKLWSDTDERYLYSKIIVLKYLSVHTSGFEAFELISKIQDTIMIGFSSVVNANTNEKQSSTM